jgi:hypothetical protein
MTIIRKPTAAGLSDPSIVRQAEASLAQSSIIANGKPAVVNSGLVLPSTTIATTSNTVVATTSTNNQSADTVTIYETGGNVYVSSIDQTIRKTTINNPIAGVSSIIAGNNITITSSNNDGTGNVTVNVSGFGNLALLNKDGNASNVLHGDGSWSADQTTYGNSNVTTLLSAFGSNTITTTGNISVGNIIGNGQALTGIAGANVGGFVPNANVANTAFAVAAANVSGLGNIATINLTGSSSNVLYGNGVFAPASGGGNSNQISNGNSNVSIPTSSSNVYINVNGGSSKQWIFDTTGNLRTPGNVDIYGAINFPQQVSNINWSTYNIELSQYGRITTNVDFFANANTIGAQYLKGDGSNISNINASNISNAYGDSNVANYLPTFTGNLNGNSLTVQQDVSGNGALRLQGIANGNSTINIGGEADIDVVANVGNINLYTANNQPWVFNQDGNLTLPNDANIAIYGNTTQFNTCANGFLGLNSYDAGGNNIARVSISSSDGLVAISATNPNTEIDYNWVFANGGITLFPILSTQRGDNPSGTISGYTLNIGDGQQEAIITTPDGTPGNEYSQRLVINPGAGNNFGEGGDIYLWAGRGGDGSGSGGDIKIRGGQGGANTTGGIGGGGGYIRIEAGDSATTGGSPGYVDINGGNSSIAQGGYVEIIGGQGATVGGDANLKGGYGTATGGNVNIWGGASGNGQVNEGHVNIQTGGNTWTFDSTGNLTLPRGGIIYETTIPGGVLTGNTIVLKPQGGTNADQQLLVYPTAIGSDFNHLHMTSGNLYNTELFLGNDDFYVKLANTGDIVINTNDDTGNTGQWIFGTDGNLSVPGNTLIYTPIATGGAGGNSITIQAGSSDSFASNPGGNLNLIGGYGSFGDGGGPPGGNVNITSGGSSDSHVGNVNITTGSNSWVFDYTGNLTTPGEVIINSNNAHGGAGYAGIMTMTNTIGGSTNPNKFVRLNSTGSLEIINSAYSNTILGLSDGGNLTVFGYAKTTATTITLLGSAATAGAGARAFATDANLVAEGNFGVVVGGSGSNIVPVYSDGTDWRIG